MPKGNNPIKRTWSRDKYLMNKVPTILPYVYSSTSCLRKIQAFVKLTRFLSCLPQKPFKVRLGHGDSCGVIVDGSSVSNHKFLWPAHICSRNIYCYPCPPVRMYIPRYVRNTLVKVHNSNIICSRAMIFHQ